MSAIRINGIRVGHQMYHLCEYPEQAGATPKSPMFLTLARAGINLPCLGLEQSTQGNTLSCCLEGELPLEIGLPAPRAVTMISVYPHGSKTATLGFLLELFGNASIPFFHMVSSNAMISFVVEEKNRARVLAALEETFDLPPTHTPYEPGFHEETAAFVKKRYQETRAYFQEKRIKTYGFSLETGLRLTTHRSGNLARVGRKIAESDTKFYFSAALKHGNQWHVHWLTSGESVLPGEETGPGKVMDLITFHGPHFGDRFGIFNTAAACLAMAGLDMVLAGCTGASVSLVVPHGQGEAALPALERGFETP